LLDAQIQAEASVAGALAAQRASLQNAGACLEELIRFSAAPNGLDGLTADLSNLFRPFETLSSDPANLPLRRSVVQSAQDIAAQLNRASFRLTALKNDLNDSIQKDVVQANRDLTDVASLNQQIIDAQAWAGRVAILADQRGQYLERLSGCVNIIASAQACGSVNVSIGGLTMVSAAETPDCLATFPDADGNLQIQAQNAGTRLNLVGGSIAGKITARDGVLASLQGGLNKLASQLITRFNSIYSVVGGLSGGTGRDFFTGTNASDINVNCVVVKDASHLQAGANASHDDAPGLDFFGQSYAQTVSDLGSTLSRVSDDLSSSQAVTQMLANERASDHAHSIDDELTDLQRYERACAISAATHTTLHKMPPMH
jgi:flagellar hook-associated protein 1 FlgK